MMSAANRLDLAVAAYSRGDLTAARREGEAALTARPDDPNLLQLLGVVYCQGGDIRRGSDYLRKAIGRGADTPDTRLNLARALLELGELAEAEAVSGESPGRSYSRDLQRMHADILKAQGRHHEAIISYERLLDSQPDDYECWNNLGNARLEAGYLDGALDALQRAKALNPRSPLIHVNVGRVLAAMGRHQDSGFLFQEAVRLAPRDPAALHELGDALRRLDRSREALVPLAAAARIKQNDPEIYVAIGLAFADLSDLPQAEQAFRVALQVAPGFAPAFLNLGILLEQANRLDELDSLIARAESQSVRGGEVDYIRALSLRRHDRFQDALDLARSSVAASIDPSTKAHFIGQVADRLNQVDVAFAAFEEMNHFMAGMAVGAAADRSAYRNHVEQLALETTRDLLSTWLEVKVEPDRPSPVFLLGFPRSGTTLLDTVLMGHADTHVLEELPVLAQVEEALGGFERLAEIGADELRELRALYFDALAKLSPSPPGSLVIDKNPLAMLRAPLIHRLFPDAKIIFALRDPRDVVLSCFMQNFKVTPSTAGFLDLTNASLLYDRVSVYWEQCREILPLCVHTVRYEAMVNDLESEVRPLLDFLDLSWDENILDHVRTAKQRGHIRTPSYSQVTERIYARALGRWQRYRSHMAHTLPTLAPWAERYGYADLAPANEFPSGA